MSKSMSDGNKTEFNFMIEKVVGGFPIRLEVHSYKSDKKIIEIKEYRLFDYFKEIKNFGEEKLDKFPLLKENFKKFQSTFEERKGFSINECFSLICEKRNLFQKANEFFEVLEDFVNLVSSLNLGDEQQKK